MTNSFDLNGKNIMVTGASSGIGKQISIYLSRQGANIIMVSKNEERLKAAYNEMVSGLPYYKPESDNHSYYAFDLANLEGIGTMIHNICGNRLKLDGLVHSAGISITMPVQFLKIIDLQNIMTVNFFSFVELVKHFSKRKYNSGKSSIVAISSISGRVGAKGLTAYSASKGALESAIKTMSLELAPKNIRINAISPGIIKTQMYDGLVDIVNSKDYESELKKRQILGLGDPEDIAYASAFLLSDLSKFITGTSMVLDGGYTAH